jgi:hypothetical protein
MVFSADFGIQNLHEFIALHKVNPDLLKRSGLAHAARSDNRQEPGGGACVISSAASPRPIIRPSC